MHHPRHVAQVYNVGGGLGEEVLKLRGREGLDLLVRGKAVEVASKKVPHYIVHFFAFNVLATETCDKIGIFGLEKPKRHGLARRHML